MKNTIRTVFAAALLAAASLGVSLASFAARGDGDSRGGVVKAELGSLRRSDKVVVDVGVTRKKLGNLRQDDLVVVDIAGAHGGGSGGGIDTNAVIDLIHEYGGGVDTNAVVDLIGEYGVRPEVDTNAVIDLIAEHGSGGVDTNEVESLIGKHYVTNTAVRIAEIESAVSGLGRDFVARGEVAAGFTKWVVMPESPLGTNIVVDALPSSGSALVIRSWSLFYEDDSVRDDSTRIADIKLASAAATNLLWAAAETQFGISVSATRVRIPTAAEVDEVSQSLSAYRRGTDADISVLYDRAKTNAYSAYLANYRAKRLEAWQYTNVVTRTDAVRGITDWSVTPTWPVGRVVVAQVSSGADAGKWSLFRPDAAVHTEATALLPPVVGVEDVSGTVTGLLWRSASWRVDAQWTNDLDAAGIPWDGLAVSGESSYVVAHMDVTASRLRLVTADAFTATSRKLGHLSAKVGQIVGFKLPKSILPVTYLYGSRGRFIDSVSDMQFVVVDELVEMRDLSAGGRLVCSFDIDTLAFYNTPYVSGGDPALSFGREPAVPGEQPVLQLGSSGLSLPSSFFPIVYAYRGSLCRVQDASGVSFTMAGDLIEMRDKNAGGRFICSFDRRTLVFYNTPYVDGGSVSLFFAGSPAIAGDRPVLSVFAVETDPSVPAWAKAAAKPTYGVDEINGLAASLSRKVDKATISATNAEFSAAVRASVASPDYSTANTQLVATIEAKAPRPDYSASNDTLVATIEAKAPRPDYSSEEFAQAVEAVSPPVVLPQKWALANVTNAGGVAVSAVDVGAATAEQGAKADTAVQPADLAPLLFSQYYPEGNVKSAAEFTRGIKYTLTTNETGRTAMVKPFCNTDTVANDNSDLEGRVVIPPFVDASGNPYISDDGTRFKVVAVSGGLSYDYNRNLTAIVAPDTVTTIGDSAFEHCPSLTSVSLFAATGIGDNAFSDCTSLSSVSFPSATTIGDNAFFGSSALSSVSFPAATNIGGSAFSSCTSLSSVSLPAVTTIGSYAFRRCTALASVLLPAVTTIGDSAFEHCPSLTSVSFPSAATIGDHVFDHCTSLSSVSFPSATTIGDYVFDHCTSLTSVDFGDTPRSSVPSFGKDAFLKVPTTCKIIVPYAQYDAWTEASGWRSLVGRGYKFLRHSEWEYARRYELQAAANAAQTAAVSAANAYTDASISKTNSAFVTAVQASVTAPDYSTANTQLVETIQATAPPPGNYVAVSNKAMNAASRSEMDELRDTKMEISAIAEALKHIKTGDYEDMDAIADRLDALIRALKGIYIPDDYEIEGDTLYFRGLEAGSTVSMVHSADAVEASAMDASESPALSVDLEYSMGDSGVWAPFLTTGTPTVVTLKKGEWVRIRAPEGVTNETFTTSDWEDIVHFTSSGRVEVGGNLMSLFYHDAAGATVFPTTNACAAAALFGECAGLVDASKLELPTISVEDRCYEYMFGGCTNLVSPPAVLPATNLSWSCYSAMFQDCTALTNAPALPATALAVGCYDVMFDGCASLVAAPELPATNLEAYCYSYMFGGCTALASAPTLPATALAASCYSGMFDGCTAMTNAPALPATVLATSCYESMFHGCTSLVAAPDLPAYAMTNRCCFAMFRGCTSLAVAPALPAETLASKCYYEMFRGCSSLSSVTADLTSLGAGGPTDNWLTGTAANGTFHGRHTLGIPQRGGSTVPAGWTVEKDRYGSTLYFDSMADGATVALHGPVPVTLEYSVDGGASWSRLRTADDDYTTVPLDKGERMLIRTPAGATNTHYGASSYDLSTRFHVPPSPESGTLDSPDMVSVGGNLLALYSQEAVRENSFPDQSEYAAAYLFCDCAALTDASGLVLPAGRVFNSCCYRMFALTIGLYAPPVLLATNLAYSCYSDMFSASAIEYAPALPATTLADHCYDSMFLSSAIAGMPALPATTLAPACYRCMFANCAMLWGVCDLPATNLAANCYEGMFSSSSIREAPYLPATTLADSCYVSMFSNCPDLSSVTVEFTSFGDGSATGGWLSSVAQSGTFTGRSALLAASRGPSTIPEGWDFVDLHPLDDSTLYFKSRADGSSVSLTPVGVGAPSVSLEYSVGGGPWAPLATNGTAVALSTGMWMRVRAPEGVTNTAFATPLGDCVKFTVRGRIAVGGNLMSIFYHDTSAPGANEFPATPDRATFQLFAGDDGGAVEDASELLLPATNLTAGCYAWMFYGCPIADAPALPATVMAESCYAYMFAGCSSLTNPPVLPAVELAPGCYGGMFSGCYSLTHAPYLPATNLVEGCYSAMFNGCSGLISLSVGFSRFDDYTATYSWLSNAGPSAGGVFRGGPGMTVPYENRSESTVPVNWVIAGDGYPYDGSTMYFRALGDDSAVSYNNAALGYPVLYSVDEGATWHDLLMEGGNYVHLGAGDVVHLRGYSDPSSPNSYVGAAFNDGTLYGQFAVGGNPAALLGGAPIGSNAFNSMFYSNSALCSAADLVMPASNITYGCCFLMFYGCNNLTDAPALPALDLNCSCYEAMFQDCTSLVDAPELPATNLALGGYCYSAMFQGCTSLVDPPGLPATTLAEFCYHSMFAGCTSLVAGPELPAVSVEPYCYSYMFSDCNGMPSYTYDLPATNLAIGCYSGMFSGTASLVEGPEILPAMNLAEECYGGMFLNSTMLQAPPALPATNLAARCYATMFQNCYSMTNAPALPAKVLAESCYNGMFMNCGCLEEAPYLPAPSLTDTCYANMFNGCGLLSRINVGFDQFRDDLHATDYWVSGVAQEGKFGFMYTFQGSYTAGDSQVPYSWDVVEYPEAVWFSSISGTSTVALRSQGPAPGVALECSTDGVAWDQFVAGGTPVRVPEGGRLYVRAPVSCVNQTFAATNANNQLGYNKFDLSGALAVGGNLMALFCSDMDGNGYPPLTHDRAAAFLFFGCTALYHAHDLRLLAQNPPPYCYQAMFSGCSNLSDGPEYLPYFGEISEGCYGSMFMGCSSLTAAPGLEAETLAKGCYNYMFKGCSSLQAVTAYFLDFSSPSGEACTTGWLDGVGANGVFHCPYSLEIPSQRSGNNVPADWTVDPMGN